MKQMTAANPRQFEYQIKDTPAFTVMDETWELIDVYPKLRGCRTIYVMVFRRELVEHKEQEAKHE